MPESYLGNLAMTRNKMSAVRQRLGLETTSGAGMRELAPSPVNGPANVRSHAQRAMQEQPDFDYDNYQIPPEKEAKMLSQIQGWIDENNNGVDDRKEAAQAAAPGAPAPAPMAPPVPAAPATASAAAPPARVAAALTPIAEFYKANGRMPTPEELQRQAAKREVSVTLGREPTDDEILLYMTAPAKGLAAKPVKVNE